MTGRTFGLALQNAGGGKLRFTVDLTLTLDTCRTWEGGRVWNYKLRKHRRVLLTWSYNGLLVEVPPVQVRQARICPRRLPVIKGVLFANPFGR